VVLRGNWGSREAWFGIDYRMARQSNAVTRVSFRKHFAYIHGLAPSPLAFGSIAATLRNLWRLPSWKSADRGGLRTATTMKNGQRNAGHLLWSGVLSACRPARSCSTACELAQRDSIVNAERLAFPFDDTALFERRDHARHRLAAHLRHGGDRAVSG